MRSENRATGDQRRVDGLILLDKPGGLTSNAALQRVRRWFRARKAGHGGTLDPLATGLLPICLGEATKWLGFLLEADKSYRFTCRLGITTTTGDAEGAVVQTRPVGHLEPAEAVGVLQRFVGEIWQTPPMYSALKQGGQRLYRLARQGLEVERRPRQVQVRELRLVSLEGDRLTCDVQCSKGLYVRVLAEDLGEALGCGAHITALRRTAVAPYEAAQMVTLQTLEDRAQQGVAALDELLQPMDTALAAWPAVHLAEDAAGRLARGQAVPAPPALTRGWVRLYEQRRARFLGIGEILADGRVAPRRLVTDS